MQEEVVISVDAQTQLKGFLTIPKAATALVIFVHGSGSSRFSLRNQRVARFLQDNQMATLLFDLLTAQEEQIDQVTQELRFDIPFLAKRLVHVTRWLTTYPATRTLCFGYFGASTGAAAALIAAVECKNIGAIVSRGGRVDLAKNTLLQVQSPCLFIVGGLDQDVIELNESAYQLLTCTKKLEIIPAAGHLFEEKGALEQVAKIAGHWFEMYVS